MLSWEPSSLETTQVKGSQQQGTGAAFCGPPCILAYVMPRLPRAITPTSPIRSHLLILICLFSPFNLATFPVLLSISLYAIYMFHWTNEKATSNEHDAMQPSSTRTLTVPETLSG